MTKHLDNPLFFLGRQGLVSSLIIGLAGNRVSWKQYKSFAHFWLHTDFQLIKIGFATFLDIIQVADTCNNSLSTQVTPFTSLDW